MLAAALVFAAVWLGLHCLAGDGLLAGLFGEALFPLMSHAAA